MGAERKRVDWQDRPGMVGLGTDWRGLEGIGRNGLQRRGTQWLAEATHARAGLILYWLGSSGGEWRGAKWIGNARQERFGCARRG